MSIILNVEFKHKNNQHILFTCKNTRSISSKTTKVKKIQNVNTRRG